MQIPMEFLSLPTTRTDSGAGVPSASRSSPAKTNTRFEKIFANELDRHDQKVTEKQRDPKGNTENPKSVEKAGDEAVKKKKDEIINNNEEAIAAGVICSSDTNVGKQVQEVVSILEGEESVNPVTRDMSPQKRADDTVPQIETKPATSATPGTGGTDIEKPAEFAEVMAQEINSKADRTQEQNTTHAQTTGTAVFTEIKETVNAKPEATYETAKADVAGENTARTPEVIRPDDEKQDAHTGENRKDNGNPRPLENTNDAPRTEGHAEKTYTQAETAVRSHSESSRADKTDDKATEKTADKQNIRFDAKPIRSDIEKPDVKPEIKPDVKPEIKPDVKPEIKPDAKPEIKPDAKPEIKPVAISADTATVTAPPLPLSEGIKPEQFKATEQMSQAAFARASAAENVFEEMISKVETMQNPSKTTMNIQLNPEFLGKVALEVSLDISGLHVKIKADDSGVKDTINAGLTRLIETLENKGITVSEVEVVFAGANFDNLSQQKGDHYESGKQRQMAKQNITPANTVEYYTAVTGLMDYYLDMGVSSVEYSA